MKTKLLLLALSAALVSPLIAADTNAKRLAQLPTSVRQAAQALVGDGRLMDIERTVENGHTVFEGQFRRDGVVRGFTLAADGMLISKQVFEKELPPAVAQTLRTQLAEAQLGEIYWTNDDGDTYFEATYVKGGLKHAVTTLADGTLVSLQLPLTEVPAAVLKAIRERKAFVVRLEQIIEDDESTYEVLLRSRGKTTKLELKADGTPK